MATDRIITGSGVSMQRVGPVPLAWAAALRVNHDIIIQASIEYVVLSLLIPFDRKFSVRVGRNREYIRWFPSGRIVQNTCSVRILV